jgi:hypothetical protein
LLPVDADLLRETSAVYNRASFCPPYPDTRHDHSMTAEAPHQASLLLSNQSVSFDGLRRHPVAWPLAMCLALTLVWAALAPLRYPSRELLFEIPSGTSARRMAGDLAQIVPPAVRLTLGVQDVLLLRNSDTVVQRFGPVLIMPGQEFRLPFEQVSDYQFASSAHTSGHMAVAVVALPDPGWARLRWRLGALNDAIRYLKPPPRNTGAIRAEPVR